MGAELVGWILVAGIVFNFALLIVAVAKGEVLK
jgi:hypothetical protein